MPRYPRGAVIPTGTGMPHITSNVQDAAAKLIENVDVHASAAIADSKITPVPSTSLTTHAALATGVHGSGANTLATDADITTHAALTTGTHGAGTGSIAIINAGTYVGNATANRAVAHGLGVIPKLVKITTTSAVNGREATIMGNSGILVQHFGSASYHAHPGVTAADATNFYVGSDEIGMNSEAANFRFVAMV